MSQLLTLLLAVCRLISDEVTRGQISNHVWMKFSAAFPNRVS